MLAIPVKNTIQFYETDKWTKKNTYENDSIDQVCLEFIYERVFVKDFVC